MSLQSALQDTPRPERAAVIQAIRAVNAAIEKHNATTNDFANKVKEACETLDRCYVAEAFEEYQEISGKVTAAHSTLQKLHKPQTLKNDIEAIEREIVEHRKPAEELNTELVLI